MVPDTFLENANIRDKTKSMDKVATSYCPPGMIVPMIKIAPIKTNKAEVAQPPKTKEG